MRLEQPYDRVYINDTIRRIFYVDNDIYFISQIRISFAGIAYVILCYRFS